MDMLRRGGENFVYRIESEVFEPRIGVSMPEMLRRDNQYRKQFNIPRGDHYAMTVNVTRQNMSGELVFDLPRLPAGVTWEAGTIPKNLSQFPILFKAAPDAPIAGSFYDLIVKNTDPAKPVSGKYEQVINFVRGNPNGTSYYASSNDKLPIAVTEKAPFRITIDQPKVPIVRDGTMKLKVRAHRDPGFEKKITARMLWRPPGISCPATMTFSEKATEIEYEVNANSSAALGDWKICILADSDAGKGVIFTSSPFINLKVEEPFVSMKLSMANVIQGENGELHCSVENLREFSGQADVQLYGLPAKTTTTVLKADKNTKELRFPVTTAPDSPIGQHKNLFCTLVFMQNGEPIQHRVGMGGVIRVDRKPKVVAQVAPKKDNKPAPAPKAAPPKPAKPLSRLEQLRLEAKKNQGQ
jgi:hypothetical protein